MSVQIFLQGKILGTEEFVLSPAGEGGDSSEFEGERLLAGRSRWIALLSEVLPRALLAELGLARILLGSSGGGQFLVVLPAEARKDAEDFMAAAAGDIDRHSGGALTLIHAVTENLGDWSVVRKRLSDEIQYKRGTPGAALAPESFAQAVETWAQAADGYFMEELACALQQAETAGWSPESPGLVRAGAGKHTWPLASSPSQDAILMARHTATTDDGALPASRRTLAERAEGVSAWGVLRGDVDNFGVRFRRAQTIEEHIQLSVMYKQFFAGELELLCSLPEYWRKVTILYSGGDDFAVYGAWDALIPLAREIQRLFHRFSEENLKEFPGLEGKTITMAMAFAAEPGSPFAPVYEEAGRRLELAKSTDKDCIHLLGHTLEWRQLAAASDLRETIQRMAAEMESPRLFLSDLAVFYRRATATEGYSNQPWRIFGRLNRALPDARNREMQKLRSHLVNEMLAKSLSQVKLRPGGRVALQWTKLLTEV